MVSEMNRGLQRTASELAVYEPLTENALYGTKRRDRFMSIVHDNSIAILSFHYARYE